MNKIETEFIATYSKTFLKKFDGLKKIQAHMLKDKKHLVAMFGLNSKNRYRYRISNTDIQNILKTRITYKRVDVIVTRTLKLMYGDEYISHDWFKDTITLSTGTLCLISILKHEKFMSTLSDTDISFMVDNYTINPYRDINICWDRFIEKLNIKNISDTKYEFYLSLNVLDYITCSYGSFRSCFSMGGSYENGSMVYANDNSTMILFSCSPDDIFRKTGRSWFHVNPYTHVESEHIMINRGYGILSEGAPCLYKLLASTITHILGYKYKKTKAGTYISKVHSNTFIDQYGSIIYNQQSSVVPTILGHHKILLTEGFCVACGERTIYKNKGYCDKCSVNMIPCNICDTKVHEFTHYNGKMFCTLCAKKYLTKCSDCDTIIDVKNSHNIRIDNIDKCICVKCLQLYNLNKCTYCGKYHDRSTSENVIKFGYDTTDKVLFICPRCVKLAKPCIHCKSMTLYNFHIYANGVMCGECESSGIVSINYNTCTKCKRIFKNKSIKRVNSIDSYGNVRHCKDCINNNPNDYVGTCNYCKHIVRNGDQSIKDGLLYHKLCSPKDKI